MDVLRRIWVGCGLALLTAIGVVHASGLPQATDLSADAERSAATGSAILVFYMTEGCPYCQHVEELYLEPMLERRTYGDRLLIRAVRSDRAQPLRDFSGARTDHQTFARRQGAFITPVVQLYAPDGTALGTPLIGYTSPDFYAGELEGRIEAALAQTGQTTARAATER